jgi:Flp pilus assembly protein TadD
VYPFDPDFYNQLAVSLWQRKQPGDLELGISNVRKAIELDPNHCIYWDNLAKALAGINRTQEARDALAHAAHCPTTPEKLAEIQDNIRTLDNALAKQAASQQSNQLAPPNQ